MQLRAPFNYNKTAWGSPHFYREWNIFKDKLLWSLQTCLNFIYWVGSLGTQWTGVAGPYHLDLYSQNRSVLIKISRFLEGGGGGDDWWWAMLNGSEGNVAWGDATIMKNKTRKKPDEPLCSSGTPGQCHWGLSDELGPEQHQAGTPCMHWTETKLSGSDGKQVTVTARHLCAPAFLLSLSPRYLWAAMGPGNCSPALQEHLQTLHLVLLIFTGFTWG